MTLEDLKIVIEARVSLALVGVNTSYGFLDRQSYDLGYADALSELLELWMTDTEREVADKTFRTQLAGDDK